MKFAEYDKLFEEDEQTHCTNHLKPDGFGGLKFPLISSGLRTALENNHGKDLLYEHYVCAKCGFPDKFYVRFCYYCEKEFYGIPKKQKCTPCSKIDWGF